MELGGVDLGTVTTIVTLITSLGALVVALRKARTEEHVGEADAAAQLAQATQGLLAPLNQQIELLQAQLKALDAKLKLRDVEIEQLKRLVLDKDQLIHDLQRKVEEQRLRIMRLEDHNDH